MINGFINATKVLVKEAEKKEAVTKAGIILTNIAVKDPQITGDVIQVGSGLPAVPMEARVGERVLFYPTSAQRFNIGDDAVMLLDCRDILFRYVPESNL